MTIQFVKSPSEVHIVCHKIYNAGKKGIVFWRIQVAWVMAWCLVVSIYI